MVQGRRRGAVRGARSVDEPGQFLSRRFRFKRFKFAVRRFRFRLYGEVNPWVLLATGEVRHLDDTDPRIANRRVGERVNMGDGTEGILIGRVDYDAPNGTGINGSDRTGSRYVQDLADDQAKAIDEFESLNQLDDIGRGDRIRGGARSERVSLRKEVREEIFKNAETGRLDANGNMIYMDMKTRLDIPNYGTHYPNETPLGHPHPKAGQPVPPNLVGKPRADIGHRDGEAWVRRLEEHKSQGRTREEIIELENDAELYVLEERSSNRSRKLD